MNGLAGLLFIWLLPFFPDLISGPKKNANDEWRAAHCIKDEHFYNSRGICEPCGHKEGQ